MTHIDGVSCKLIVSFLSVLEFDIFADKEPQQLSRKRIHLILKCINLLFYMFIIIQYGVVSMILPSSDVNECYLETDLCSAEAQCLNTDGTYECACQGDYTGDGFSCTSK